MNELGCQDTKEETLTDSIYPEEIILTPKDLVAVVLDCYSQEKEELIFGYCFFKIENSFFQILLTVTQLTVCFSFSFRM